MTNISFLTTINTAIYVSYDLKYYVRIPFILYDAENTYIDNFNNSIYILLNNELLSNDDLEEFITELDDRYVIYNGDDLTYVTTSKNYQYYSNLNVIANIDIDEDDAKNTNVTFMNILKETYTYLNPETSDYVYKYVIDFYSNGQYDDALILMNTIFNTQLSVSSQSVSCGCNQQVSNCSSSSSTNNINTGTDLINYDTATCLDKYKAAIYQWLIQMLSDTEFYCHWLFIEDEEGNNIPNDTILNKLIELLEFILDNFDLSSLGNTSNSYCGHKSSIKCNDSFNDNYGSSDSDTSACSNYNIIKNYIEALNYVKEDKVLENKNKIYIYGKKFAEIFPILNFN